MTGAKASSFDVCVCGSLNTDLVFKVRDLPRPGETVQSLDREVRLGGKGANQAVAARRFGSTVGFLGRCGDDEYGRLARAALEDEGICTENLVFDELETGLAVVVVSSDGQNSIVVSSGANASVGPDGAWPSGKVWVTQGEVPVAAVERTARAAREQGATAIVNPSPSGAIPASLVCGFEIAILNEIEYEDLGPVQPPVVIRTEGSGGATIFPSGVQIPAFAIEPVDSTGAGDVFVGFVAAAIASGDSLEDAVRLATAGAAISVAEGCGQAGYPDRSRAAALLA